MLYAQARSLVTAQQNRRIVRQRGFCLFYGVPRASIEGRDDGEEARRGGRAESYILDWTLYGFAHRAFLIIVFQTSVLRLVAAVTEIPVVKVFPSFAREQVSERSELPRREKDSEFLCLFHVCSSREFLARFFERR